MKKCKCGIDNSDDAVFCRGCGQRLPLEKVQVFQAECSHCHNINPSEAVYCQNCGLSLKPNGKITFSVNSICDVLVDNQIVKKNVKSSYTLQKEAGTYVVSFQSKEESTIKIVKTITLENGVNQSCNIDIRRILNEQKNRQNCKPFVQVSTNVDGSSDTISNTGNYSSHSSDKSPWEWIACIGFAILMIFLVGNLVLKIWDLLYGIIQLLTS